MSVRAVLIVIRMTAVLVIVMVVPLVWRLMMGLPWQIDCVLAIGAAFAFAYKFEREESR